MPHTPPKPPPAENPSSVFTVALYVLVGLTGILLSCLVGYGFFIGNHLQEFNTPLLAICRELRAEAETTHILADAALEGARDPRLATAFENLNVGIMRIKGVLRANRGAWTNLAPDHSVDIEGRIETVAARLAEYGALLRSVQAQRRTPADASSKHRLLSSYMKLRQSIHEVEDGIVLTIAQDSRRYRQVNQTLLGACMLLLAGVWLASRSHRRSTARYIRALNRSSRRLGVSEERYRIQFQHLPHPTVTFQHENGEFRIIDYNQAAHAMTGGEIASLIGRTAGDVYGDRPDILAGFRRCREEGAVISWKTPYRVVATGEDRHVILTYVALPAERVLLHIVDISAFKLAEKKLMASFRFLRIANRHQKMTPMLGDFVTELKKLTGCEAAGVRIVDDSQRIPYAVCDGLPGDICEPDGGLGVRSATGMCARVIRGCDQPKTAGLTDEGSFFVNDMERFLETAPREQLLCMRQHCRRAGFRTLGLFPIRSGDQTLGLVHVASRQPGRLPEGMRKILGAAGLLLGTAIRRVLAEEALAESYEALEFKVKQRTRELSLLNESLAAEIINHKAARKALLRYQERLRSLSTELLQTQERQRRHIAQEIHDGIGQTLAVMKFKLGALGSRLSGNGPSADVEELQALLGRTIEETRSLTFEISPPILYQLGLSPALEWLAESLWKQHACRVVVTDRLGGADIDVQYRVFLFQTLRELLLNVVKHAGVSRARLDIGSEDGALRATVSDDGVGFHPGDGNGGSVGPNGFGLFGIREQIRHYNGRLEICSAPGSGTRVILRLPHTVAGTAPQPAEKEPCHGNSRPHCR